MDSQEDWEEFINWPETRDTDTRGFDQAHNRHTSFDGHSDGLDSTSSGSPVCATDGLRCLSHLKTFKKPRDLK